MKESVENSFDLESITSALKTTTNQTILAPVDGQVISLTQLKDEIFSTLSFGDGVAMIPYGDIIKGPFFGKVKKCYNSNQSILLQSNEGLELFLHLGMNTSLLGGNFFNCMLEEDAIITPASELFRIDRNQIRKAGFSLTTPIVITNLDNYNGINNIKLGECKAGDPIFSVY